MLKKKNAIAKSNALNKKKKIANTKALNAKALNAKATKTNKKETEGWIYNIHL